jgi:hypothetical protein
MWHLEKLGVKHVQEDKGMMPNNFAFLFAFLLTTSVTGCTSTIDKSEMESLREALKNRASLIPGGKYRPCCIDIIITGEQAKDIFKKMPDSTLLTTSTEGTCLDQKIVKISEGTICTAVESHLNDPELYSCGITINYSTGATQKLDINNYLNCD